MKEIKIQKAVNGQWYHNIIAKNGKVISTGETVHNVKDCVDTAKSIIGWQFWIKIVIDI